MRRSRRETGFTLLELMLVVALIGILAGSALPVASRAWNAAARRATQVRLEALAEAGLEFCRDTGRAPRSVLELAERPDDGQGWLGPYLAIDGRAAAGGGRALLDGWGRALELRPEPGFAFVSLGPDGVFGADDLAVEVDFTPVRRAATLRELEEIEAALESFAAQHPERDLARDWTVVRELLIEAGYLPPGERHALDGWQRPYVAEPGVRFGRPRFRSLELLERGAAGG